MVLGCGCVEIEGAVVFDGDGDGLMLRVTAGLGGDAAAVRQRCQSSFSSFGVYV